MALRDVVLPVFFSKLFFLLLFQCFNILFKSNNYSFFSPYSYLHYTVHVCIVLAFFMVRFPSPTLLSPSPVLLSFISVYFSSWGPLSTSSLSEEISSYKAVGISLQENKLLSQYFYLFLKVKGR